MRSHEHVIVISLSNKVTIMTSLLSIRFGLIKSLIISECRDQRSLTMCSTPMKSESAESRTWNIMLDSAYVIQHCRRLGCASYILKVEKEVFFRFFFKTSGLGCLKRQASKYLCRLILSFIHDFVNFYFSLKTPSFEFSLVFFIWACINWDRNKGALFLSQHIQRLPSMLGERAPFTLALVLPPAESGRRNRSFSLLWRVDSYHLISWPLHETKHTNVEKWRKK